MKYDEFLTRELVSDMAKGRYNKDRVRQIMETTCRVVAKDVEKKVFEYAWLFALQTLHYEFGFGKIRLERFFNESAKAIDAFDSNAFNIDDIYQALKDDAKFECSFNWGDEDEQ